MKITSSIIATCIIVILIPISYCFYLDARLKQTMEQCEYLKRISFVLDNKLVYEERANYNNGYNNGFNNGYDSANNEAKIKEWQSSIITKGFESGIIKCYYVSENGKHIEFPLKKWISVEFPLNKWVPDKLMGEKP